MTHLLCAYISCVETQTTETSVHALAKGRSLGQEQAWEEKYMSSDSGEHVSGWVVSRSI